MKWLADAVERLVNLSANSPRSFLVGYVENPKTLRFRFYSKYERVELHLLVEFLKEQAMFID